jgi:hypothetical protein
LPFEEILELLRAIVRVDRAIPDPLEELPRYRCPLLKPSRLFESLEIGDGRFSDILIIDA